MKYIDFQGHHYGIRIAYNREGRPRLELIENKKVVYNLTTFISYSTYATLTTCSTFIDLDKYAFAEQLMQELNCKKIATFKGYDKKHPRNLVEYDISKILVAQNKELKRDKMLRKMIDITESFSISSTLVNYAVHKKFCGDDVYYLVTVDGSMYRLQKPLFVKAITTANIPVYKAFRKSDDYPRGDTYARWN